MKIVFLINANDIGGAEYVSFLHVRMALESGMDVVVLTGEDGMFCGKIKAMGVRVVEFKAFNLRSMSVAQNRFLQSVLEFADVVFNCNWFSAHAHIGALKRNCSFRYFSIIHSNITWVLDMTIPYDWLIDRYYVINQSIFHAFVGRGVNVKKLSLIENCVDVEPIRERKQEAIETARMRGDLGICEGDLVIGMTTRIAADKNILDSVRLIERVNEYRPASLVILGGASERRDSLAYEAELKERIAVSKDKDRIYLLGKMSSEQVYKKQLVFDVAVNLSPSEGLPISMLEQMAAGIYCMYPGVGDILNILLGYGFVGDIRQRLSISEIYKHYNYTDAELEQWVQHLATLSFERMKRKGNESARFIRDYRSYEIQKVQFLKFIN